MGFINKAKRAIATALVSAMAVTGFAPSVAMADSSRMVTLGADLTESERANVLKFFSLTEEDLKDMEVITVTNTDERRYLEGSLPNDVIGYKTYSCSYIEPKSSGGLRVETANLNYVTKNTLYNALQTAGVENCSLVVTAPFSVSGTGALTGVFMAYEKRGVTLDDKKKDVATEELVKTAQLEETYGEGVAEVISDVKDEVVSSNKNLSDDDIRELVKTAAKLKGIDISDADIDTILGLVQKIQGLDYDLDAFSATLDDFKQALDNATGKAEEATGFFDAIAQWFQGIIDWFKGLFGMPQDKAEEDKDATEKDSLIGDLNTDVFSLDGSSDDTEKKATSTTTDSVTKGKEEATTTSEPQTDVASTTEATTTEPASTPEATGEQGTTNGTVPATEPPAENTEGAVG